MAKEWIKECNRFEAWFKRIGGDTGNATEMCRAMQKIEPKEVKEKSIYKILEQ